MIKKPTSKELDFIKYLIWEPLRRNQDFINDCAKVKVAWSDYYIRDAFLEKWKLPYPVFDNTSFENIEDPHWVFYDHYTPLYNHAAFVLPLDFFTPENLLKVWIDPESSRNQIETAIKKELDEWKAYWTGFYNQKNKRKIEGPAVIVKDMVKNYLEININLEATRLKIEAELKEIFRHLNKWTGPKKKINRFNPDKMALIFKLYDLIEKKGWPVDDAAIKLKIKPKAAYDSFKRAYKLIYPNEPYQTKRKRKNRKIAPEVVDKNNKILLEKYANQDHVTLQEKSMPEEELPTTPVMPIKTDFIWCPDCLKDGIYTDLEFEFKNKHGCFYEMCPKHKKRYLK